MNLDATQLRYLGQRIGLIRQDWTTNALGRAVDHLPDHYDFMDVVRAAENAARDTEAKTPGVIYAYWSRYSGGAAPTPAAAAAARRQLVDTRRATAAGPEFVARLQQEAAAGNPLPFPGPWCWRHDAPDAPGGRRTALPPFDECADCLAERDAANDWRAARGLPIRAAVPAAPSPW
jgi:hypothetical protein